MDRDLNMIPTDEELDQAGFTSAAKTRYRTVVDEFGKELFDKSKAFGGRRTDREITAIHVRNATIDIQANGKKEASHWAQIGTLVCSAAAGVAGNHLDKPLGIAAFGIFLAICIVIYVNQTKRGSA
jgi:hypothetical protein